MRPAGYGASGNPHGLFSEQLLPGAVSALPAVGSGTVSGFAAGFSSLPANAVQLRNIRKQDMMGLPARPSA
jgi:hypothetical protein